VAPSVWRHIPPAAAVLLRATLPSRLLMLVSPAVVEDYGLETVQEYMFHIRANAEAAVRRLLKETVTRMGTNVLSAVDYLDDGSPVRPLPPSPRGHSPA
jgi:hypothetical protein